MGHGVFRVIRKNHFDCASHNIINISIGNHRPRRVDDKALAMCGKFLAELDARNNGKTESTPKAAVLHGGGVRCLWTNKDKSLVVEFLDLDVVHYERRENGVAVESLITSYAEINESFFEAVDWVTA